MPDVAIEFGEFGADLALGVLDLVLDQGLQTAVLISLFSDARAAGDPPYPDGSLDPRGYWGDVPANRMGSLLWHFEREKLTAATIESVRAAAEQSLAWFVTERVAGDVAVRAQRGRGLHTIELSIQITRSSAARWAHLWKHVSAASAQTLTVPGVVLHLLFR